MVIVVSFVFGMLISALCVEIVRRRIAKGGRSEIEAGDAQES